MEENGDISVVVADDESSVRALLGITLSMRHHFHIVGEASDGTEAVSMVDRSHPDAVILDLMMPVMSGMDAIPEILRLSPDTKIVVFSALSADQMEGEAMSKGAHAYIEKTKFVTELPETIERLCGAAA